MKKFFGRLATLVSLFPVAFFGWIAIRPDEAPITVFGAIVMALVFLFFAGLIFRASIRAGHFDV